MTVRELIENLQRINPEMDMEVEYFTGDGGCAGSMCITNISIEDGIIILGSC